MPKKLPDDVSRPAVLYVERVETNPAIDQYFETRRLAVIDIEIDMIQTIQIIEYLRERNNQGTAGAVRLRFTGRLIHL
jgi:hypothetical protein